MKFSFLLFNPENLKVEIQEADRETHLDFSLTRMLLAVDVTGKRRRQ